MFEDDDYEPDGSECEVCGERSQAVEWVADPYDSEVFGENHYRYLCPDCYDAAAAEI